MASKKPFKSKLPSPSFGSLSKLPGVGSVLQQDFTSFKKSRIGRAANRTRNEFPDVHVYTKQVNNRFGILIRMKEEPTDDSLVSEAMAFFRRDMSRKR
jgi:hypothetical protein